MNLFYNKKYVDFYGHINLKKKYNFVSFFNL